MEQLRRLAADAPAAATESVLEEVRQLRHALYPTLLDHGAREFTTVARYAERAVRQLRLTQPPEARRHGRRR